MIRSAPGDRRFRLVCLPTVLPQTRATVERKREWRGPFKRRGWAGTMFARCRRPQLSPRLASSTAILAPAPSTRSSRLSGGRNAVVRNRHRHRVADPVDPDPDRLVQIRDPHNARRQSRGRWNRRALGAPRCPACASQELARLPLDSRVDRRSVALWRRCHHPGDLGVERNRGPEARCPSTRTDGCADQPCDPGRPLPSAAQGDGVHRR